MSETVLDLLWLRFFGKIDFLIQTLIFLTLIQKGIVYSKRVPYFKKLLRIKSKSGYALGCTKLNACCS